MATATPSQLKRFVRTGSVPTRTVPRTDHVMNDLSARTGDSVEDDDDDPMATLSAALGPAAVEAAPGPSGPPPAAPSQPSEPEAAASRRTPGSRAARYGGGAHVVDRADSADVDVETAAPAPPPQPVASEPTSPVPLLHAPASRAARFGATVVDPLERAAVARPSPVKIGPLTTQAGAKPEGRRAWEGLSPSVVGARQAMQAAKVVAPLVAAVSFYPGAGAHKGELSKALSTMLVAVNKGATAVAEHWSSVRGKDVPIWLVSQLMQSYAEVVAKRWESTGTADIEQMTAEMCQLLTSEDGEVARMLMEVSDQAYVEATSADVAANRIAASTIAAAWQLWDSVHHEVLLLSEDVSERPVTYYSYERDPAEVVDKLLRMCLGVCRAMPLNVDHADTRVSHMQSSIRRMASLVGAEYVSQTRFVCKWIAEKEAFSEEWRERRSNAAADFEPRILPHICEWARQNFVRVQQGAYGAVEELIEKPTSHAAGSSSAARPVHQ